MELAGNARGGGGGLGCEHRFCAVLWEAEAVNCLGGALTKCRGADRLLGGALGVRFPAGWPGAVRWGEAGGWHRGRITSASAVPLPLAPGPCVAGPLVFFKRNCSYVLTKVGF